MKRNISKICLIIMIFLFWGKNLYAQEVPEMYVVGNAELRPDELVGQNKRDENGDLCAIIKIVSNLDELQFTSYNGVVEIDNSRPGLYLVYVSPGERVVEVYRTGFKPLQIILSEFAVSRVESGQVWQLEVTGDISVLMDTGTGDLVLETQPSGAEIRIDGLPVFNEITPYTFSNYSARPYKFSITKNRYEPVDTLIVIEKDKELSLSIELAPITGLLSINSNIPNTSFTVTDLETNIVIYNDTGNPDQNVLIGDYRIDAAAPEYIGLSQTVTITENSSETVNILFTEQQRTEYLTARTIKRRIITRSLVFPGSGQRFAEYRGKGNLITTLQAITLVGAVGSTVLSINAQSDYDEARTIYKTASNNQEASIYHDDIQKKYDDASSAYTIQMAVIGVALCVYLWNVIDAALTEPKGNIEPQMESMRIEPRFNKDITGVYISLKF